MKHSSIQSRLKSLTEVTSLSLSSKERIRRNLDLETAGMLKEQHIERRSSIRRRLATTMTVVAPLLILLVGYELLNEWHIDTMSNEQHVAPIALTELVMPNTLPTGFANDPTVTLNYADHSHYQYALDYTGKLPGTRFSILEGSTPTKQYTTPSQATWTISGISVQVFQPEQSQISALFSYAGRHYTVIASELSRMDVKVVVTSLVDSAIKRG